MFASLTFALMKYVDFSATFSSIGAGGRDAGAQAASTYGGSRLSTAVSRQQQQELNNNNNNEHDDDEQDDSSTNMMASGRRQRARVITLAADANNSTLSDRGKH